jgi:alanine dehydrogenase
MIIGVIKEIKNNENRVGLTPANVAELVKAGHTLLVETKAGEGSNFLDKEYQKSGAKIVKKAKDIWAKAEMIVKVKEPLKPEYSYFREGLIIFTFFHLASNKELTMALIKSKVVAIAYETVELENKNLPILTPMSEVAGRMSVQIGAHFLEKYNGGRGVLLGGTSKVSPSDVVIIGGGIVGKNATKMAIGLGARVTMLDINENVLKLYKAEYGDKIQTLVSNPLNITNSVKKADLLIGAVLIHGAKAPKLVKESLVKQMKKGSVIVDVAVDQGGIVETIDRVTTHDNPTYVKHGVIHYSVANMPGAVPNTSTLALTTTTFPYALQLATLGWKGALKASKPLSLGANIILGKVVYKAVADDFKLKHTPLIELL